MVLTPAQQEVVSKAEQQEHDLTELRKLLRSRGLIRGTHALRLRKKTTPAWFWLPPRRRSFKAVLRLQVLCSSENVRTLLARRWISTLQIERFIKRTKLGDGPWGILEAAVREERARVSAHTDTGHTQELRSMMAGEPASAQLRPANAGTAGRHRQPV